MPRIPPDQRSPFGTAAATKRSNPPAETANPHRRQGDRASGDNDSEVERREAKRAARRSRLVQSGFPVFCRFDDLVAAGIVANRTTLLRLIDDENFPPGTMIGLNTRAWRLGEVEAWLESRPSARKAVPPDAVHPRVRDKRRAAERGDEA